MEVVEKRPKKLLSVCSTLQNEVELDWCALILSQSKKAHQALLDVRWLKMEELCSQVGCEDPRNDC